MRILIVASLYPPHPGGGAEIAVQEQAERLAERGHEVAVATLEPGSTLRDEAQGGVTVWRVPAGNLYFHGRPASRPPALRVGWHVIDSLVADHARPLGHLLREHRPDVISVHNIVGFGAGAIEVLARHGAPMAMTLHDQSTVCVRALPPPGCPTRCTPCRVLRRRYVAATSRFAAVIGVSRFVLEATLRAGAFAATPVRQVLHNPLLRPRRMLGTPARAGGEAPVLGYLGALNPGKGVDRLVDAFRRSAAPDARLLLAGRGEPGYLETLRRRLAGTNAQLLGQVAPAAFYGAIDRLFVPSIIDDSLPGVVIEGLAAGIPVHGSRRGGIPEIAFAGRRAELFDIDAAGALEAVIAETSRVPSAARAALDETWLARREAEAQQWIERCEAILAGLRG